MLLQTDYIILRKVPFQESSLIVSGLSPDFGRLDFLLKGARGSGAKKFPYAGLFRELSIEFKDNAGESNLLYLKSHEPKSCFDAIADFPENYLNMCEYARFLLRHTRPMLEMPLTYEALRLCLLRLSARADSDFPTEAAKLVFLRESGMAPDAPADDSGRGAVLEKILQYALDLSVSPSVFQPEYREKLIRWIRALEQYADGWMT